MTYKFDSSRFAAFSFRKHSNGEFIQRLLADIFDSINPYEAVKKYLYKNKLPKAKNIFAFGLGKAAIAMTQAIADEISLTDSIIITKHASILDIEPVTVILGNHPIPSVESLKAGIEAKKFLSQLTKDDLLICLISGGGSALMTAPIIPLSDLQKLTSALLSCGANIDEINTLRRHLDELKGGGLVEFANGAQILSLILSDVVGDSLEAIASGITAPDVTTVEDAVAILEKYKIKNEIFTWHETMKPNHPIFERVTNQITASNQTALEFACSQIRTFQFEVKIITATLQGEASEVGKQLALQFNEELQTTARPFCLLAGGETTVTVTGNGKGGRNQELALATVEILSGLENIFFISIATDGEDGPTDAAGAVVTGETYQRSKMLGLEIAGYKSRNDAYAFFAELDDLIKIGASATNVNDVVICLAL